MLRGDPVRSAARLLVCALALALLVACSHGSSSKKPAHASEKVAAWDAAYTKTLHGLSGSFRSLVVGTPCTEPIRKPCVVGGAQISDVGTFTLTPNSARYEHHAFGLDAAVSEETGYRALHLKNPLQYPRLVTGYVSAIGRTSHGGCWAPVRNFPSFGSRWPLFPQGFTLMLNADAVKDPAFTGKAMRFGGVADVYEVLEFLGLQRLYDDHASYYHWRSTRVPIELRIDADGRPVGFGVNGEQIAEFLVGPDPDKNPNAPAMFVEYSADRTRDAEVRHALAPMHGEFTLYGLGKTHAMPLPAKNRRLTAYTRGDDPCPGNR